MSERTQAIGLALGLFGMGAGGLLLLFRCRWPEARERLAPWTAAWWSLWMIGMVGYFWGVQGDLTPDRPLLLWTAQPSPSCLIAWDTVALRPRQVLEPKEDPEGFPRAPQAVASDEGNFLYVVDASPPRLLLMDREGHVWNEWHHLSHPYDVATGWTWVGEGEFGFLELGLFVTDGGEQALWKLSRSGEVVGKVNSFRGEPFRQVAGVGTAPWGVVLVADRGAGRVYAFDERLKPLRFWEGFQEPLDVAGDRLGRLFVAERQRVWMVRPFGSPRLLWQGERSLRSLALRSTAWETLLWIFPEQGNPLVLRLPRPETVEEAQPSAQGPSRRWPAVPSFLLLTMAAWGLGCGLIRLARIPRQPPAEQALWTLGLGWIGWMMISSLLGALGGWRREVVLPLLLLTSFAGLPELVRWARGLRGRNSFTRAAAWEYALLGGYGVLTFLLALAPPMDADALIYHLTVPRWNAEAHRWVHLPFISSHFPMGLESLYTLGFLVGEDSVAQLLHWAMGVLTLLGVWALGRRWFSEEVARRAMLLLASVYTFSLIAFWGYVDLGTTAMETLAVVGLQEGWRRRGMERWRWWRAAACCAGAALSTKYFAFFPFLLLGGMVLLLSSWERWRRGEPHPLQWAVVTAGAWWAWGLLLFLPFAVKNALFTGNPFYPFLSSWLGGEFLEAERLRYMHHFVHDWTGMGRTPAHWLLLPWTFTHYGRIHDWYHFNGPLSPLFLAFGVAVLWVLAGGGWRDGRRLWLGYCLLYFLAWAASVQSTRQLLPMLPVAAVLVMGAATRWIREEWREAPWLQALWLAVLYLQALLNGEALLKGGLAQERLSAALGILPRHVYLSRHCAVYPPSQWMNRHLPPGARVLWLWEDRTYYSRHFPWVDGVLESFWWLVRWQNMDAQEWMADLRRLGVTHIFRSLEREFIYGIATPRTFRHRWEQHRFYRQFFHLKDLLAEAEGKGLLRPIQSGGGWVVYEVGGG